MASGKANTRGTVPEGSLHGKWHRQADVVIIGYGAAGASAAITAHDAGADVLILEKAPVEFAGGNSKVSAQGILSTLDFSSDAKIVKNAASFIKALNDVYLVPDDMIRSYVEGIAYNRDWLVSLGADPREFIVSPVIKVSEFGYTALTEFPELRGSKYLCLYNFREMGNQSIWKLLCDSVEKRGIMVICDTPARGLIQDPVTKAILGVIAENNGKEIIIKSRKGVVLTCGGFENNQEMVRDYLSDMACCYPKGTPYNTGDGIKMAMEVGADLWHMKSRVARIGFKLPDFDVSSSLRYPTMGFIRIAKEGKRFMRELPETRHGKVLEHGQWVDSPTPMPMYNIFDENHRAAGPVASGYMTGSLSGFLREHHLYDWSEDNAAEVGKGWIAKADTIKELAKKIGVAPALEETVKRWNKMCDSGKDVDFQRPAKFMAPLQVPPYYAMKLAPMFVNTQGGPRRNARAEVLSVKGNPIPRLYSAGELGSMWGYLYTGGGNLSECMVFGRIAGQHVAAEDQE